MYKNSGIYQIRNAENNKIYIGSSVDIANRWRQHKRLLIKSSHPNPHLQESWNKYGEGVFCFEILEIAEITTILDKEQQYIDKLNPEYNIARFVKRPMLGIKASDETKRKMSENRTGSKNSFWGMLHTEETKKKISAWRTGRRFGFRSEETKKKISNSQAGTKNSFYGNNHSDIAKEKISRASKERVFSPESRKKLSERIRGENHYNTKLSDDSVREIRLLWKTGEHSQVAIGKMFGVSNKVVNNIVNFHTWKHLNDEFNFA